MHAAKLGLAVFRHGGRNVRDEHAGRVGGKDGVWGSDLVERREEFLFELEVFDHCLDHDVGVLDGLETGRETALG